VQLLYEALERRPVELTAASFFLEEAVEEVTCGKLFSQYILPPE